MMSSMSRYRLSNSWPLGLGPVQSTGTFMLFMSQGSSSTTSLMIRGYFSLSQR